MTRRAITRADEASIRARVGEACPAIERRQMFCYAGGNSSETAGASAPLVRIEVNGGRALRGLSAPELSAMARAGIHPGADGWEIEETAPAVKVGDLFRSRKSGETWRVERYLPTDALWAIRAADGGTLYMIEPNLLDPAQWTREVPAIARPPLPPGFGWFQRGVDSYSLDGPNDKPIAKAHHDGRSWTWSILSTFVRTTARDLREAQERTEEACRAAGLFDAPTVTTDVRQGAGMGEQARIVAGIADGGDGFDDAEELLCQLLANEQRCAVDIERERIASAFVAALKSELRASLPAPSMPSPRTTDGALTAYLLEHHRDAWRPGEDALALAIRLLGTQSHAIDMVGESLRSARVEAQLSDANAVELEVELRRVRGELTRETERRIVAEQGRGEALGDLATVRADVLKSAHDLAARMGAPHG